MGYISLYRKWRPQTFSDVIGQEYVVTTLENSLNSGRISHAYLFAGPRGTGKTTVARLMAKGLDCINGPTSSPCGVCDECVAIARGTSLNVVEIDGASNRGIDEIRELREQVRFAPVGAQYKVYIIDEVHMLTTDAFNALLKTLEEPPAHVVFICATTDPHKIPATVLSRMQRFDFKRFSIESLVSRLQTVVEGEEVQVDDGVLEIIAKHSEGGMRDALGILEQCMTFTDHLTPQSVAEVLGIAPFEMVMSFSHALFAQDKSKTLTWVNELYNQGKDLLQFVRSVLDVLRSEVIKDDPLWNRDKILAAIEVFSQCTRDMRYAVDPRIPLEIGVLKLCTGEGSDDSELEELKSKVRMLEGEVEKLKNRVVAVKRQSTSEPKKSVSPPPKPRPPKNDEARTQFIAEHWEDYLHALRTERLVQCEAFLREGSPVGVQENELIVAFPRDRGFHKASIEQTNHREPAERVLSKLMGSTLTIQCTFEDEVQQEQEKEETKVSEPETTVPEQSDPPKKADEQEQINEKNLDDTVTAALRIFGGRVVKKPD